MKPIGSDIDFLKAIAETMMEAHDRFYVEQANYARTIPIPTMGVRTTEFDITAGAGRGAVRVGPGGGARIPGHVGLRGLQGEVQAGPGVSRRDTVAAPTATPASAP